MDLYINFILTKDLDGSPMLGEDGEPIKYFSTDGTLVYGMVGRGEATIVDAYQKPGAMTLDGSSGNGCPFPPGVRG